MAKLYKEKFVSSDRELVIAELEKIQQTELSAILPSKKVYVDTKGMSYFILGGTGDWHGISKNIIRELKSYSKEGAFVIAKKYKSRIDLCGLIDKSYSESRQIVANKTKRLAISYSSC